MGWLGGSQGPLLQLRVGLCYSVKEVTWLLRCQASNIHQSKFVEMMGHEVQFRKLLSVEGLPRATATYQALFLSVLTELWGWGWLTSIVTKLRQRGSEVMKLVPDAVAGKWWSWDSDPGLTLKLMLPGA